MTKTANSTPRHAASTDVTWVVVADAGRARVLEALGADGSLNEFDDLINPGARLQEHDVVSDRKGRVTQGPAGVGQSFEPRHSQAAHEAEGFARQVCERLDAARQSGEFAKLYLIAEPAFLGLIRKQMSAPVRKLIREEIASDLSRHPVGEIRKVLPERL